MGPHREWRLRPDMASACPFRHCSSTPLRELAVLRCKALAYKVHSQCHYSQTNLKITSYLLPFKGPTRAPSTKLRFIWLTARKKELSGKSRVALALRLKAPKFLPAFKTILSCVNRCYPVSSRVLSSHNFETGLISERTSVY